MLSYLKKGSLCCYVLMSIQYAIEKHVTLAADPISINPSCVWNQAYVENYEEDKIDEIISGAQDCYILIDPFHSDMNNNPAQVIADIKENSSNSVGCYMSSSTCESWRDDFDDIAAYCVDQEWGDWDGEYFVFDVDGILPFMKLRMDEMANWGCDYVEFDNMDWCTDTDYREEYGSTTGQEFPSIQDCAQYNMDLCEYARTTHSMLCMSKNSGYTTDDNEYAGGDTMDAVTFESFPSSTGGLNWWSDEHLQGFLDNDKPVIIVHYNAASDNPNNCNSCEYVLGQYQLRYDSDRISFICESRSSQKYIHDVQANTDVSLSSSCPSSSFCLSSYATANVQNTNEVVYMKNLKEGMDIMVSSSSSSATATASSSNHGSTEKYEQVYAFGHKNEYALARFLQIQTFGEHDNIIFTSPLEISGEHLLYKQDALSSLPIPVRADSIQVGDHLVVNGGSSQESERVVTKITHVDRQGIYSPLVKDGSFLANGILVSSYTAIAAGPSSDNNHPRYFVVGGNTLETTPVRISHHFINHVAIAPFYFLCTGRERSLVGAIHFICNQRNAEGQLLFPAMGEQLLFWWTNQLLPVQTIVLIMLLMNLFPFYILGQVSDIASCSFWFTMVVGSLFILYMGGITFQLLFLQKRNARKRK